MRDLRAICLVGLLSGSVLPACVYDASFSDCAVRCAADGACPAGLACDGSGTWCRTSGEVACDTVAVVQSPSCVGLPATCGPSGSDDCCSVATSIPGGTFYRSYDVGSDGMYPSMSYPATVSAFELDKYEATVGRFRAFVAAGGGTQANPPAAGAGANATLPDSGWDPSWDADLLTDTTGLSEALKCDANGPQTWTDAPGGDETLPINCVTWFEAVAFCAWDGGFLPTEAEWNYAAAAGNEQRAYPWSIPAASLAIGCAEADYDACTGSVSHVGAASPAGDGAWGHADMAGNVNEWVLDSFDAYASTCDDCADLASAADKVDRGGSFFDGPPTLRTGIRGHVPPTARYGNVGVRCARVPN